jgi:hypothetical protein
LELLYIKNAHLLAWTVVVLAGCETPAERQARENAAIEKAAAKEINRICAARGQTGN